MPKLVVKRDDSPYYYTQLPVLDATGRVVDYERKSTKRTNQKEAEKVAVVRSKQLLDEAQFGRREDMSLDQFLDDCVRASKKKSDHKNQVVYVKHIKRLMGKRQFVSNLTSALMFRIRREFEAEDYSENYINNLMTFMISCYNQAKKMNLAVPLGEDFGGLKTKVNGKVRYLMSGEEPRLLKQLDPYRPLVNNLDYDQRCLKQPDLQRSLHDQYDQVVFLIDTGCRYTESTLAPKVAIEGDLKGINLYREKVGNEGYIEFTDRLREILERRFRTDHNSPYIFSSPFDPSKPRSYSMSGVRKAIIRAGLNADHLVKRYGRFTAAHCFRHTFASRLAQSGQLTLQEIAHLLGHADIQMTQKYAHLIPGEASKKAVSVLNGINR
tara:strand:+ start:528 stop:1670 length:1143 start_codon:yes stop_codon:yes gene_type:complete